MKSDDIYNAVTELRDDQVQAGEKALRVGRPRRLRRLGALAAVLALLILAGVAAGPRLAALLRQEQSGTPSDTGSTEPKGGEVPKPTGTQDAPTGGKYSLASAAWPRMAPYPNEMSFMSNGAFNEAAYDAAREAWLESRSALRPEGDYTQGLSGYLKAVLPGLLSGAGEENKAVSPLNIYMALAMLAETTAGEGRQELLRLLNSPDIGTLRQQANALWRSNYCNDGRQTLILGASLWLRDDMDYQADTLGLLASDYYGSVYAGKMGSAEYDQALRDWMNAQTQGLLSEQIGELRMEPETVMNLVTTIYLKEAWTDEFWKKEERSFHAPAGDRSCEFLLESSIAELYTGDGFTAAGKSLQGGGSMYVLLPQQGLDPESLLEREGVLDFLTDSPGRDRTEHHSVCLELAVPKFDVNGHTELGDLLKSLGVETVFDETRADFSPLSRESQGFHLSKALHDARLMIDEKGVTGAAYTVLATEGAADPSSLEQAELILDRPFLFVVTNSDGLPLFIGAVAEP